MRNERDVTITAEGRDKGKKFHIVEMSAWAGWDWAVRVLLALMNAGVKNVDLSGGMAALSGIGILKILSSLRYEDAKPLMDEMMKCVARVESPTATRSLVESDIEEVKTLFFLHKEVLELHLGFSLAEKFRTSESGPIGKASSTT